MYFFVFKVAIYLSKLNIKQTKNIKKEGDREQIKHKTNKKRQERRWSGTNKSYNDPDILIYILISEAKFMDNTHYSYTKIVPLV